MLRRDVLKFMGHGAAGKTFSGVTLHRNQLGFLLGLLILISLFVLRFRFRWPHVLNCLAAAGLLIYIDSKSAIISIAFTAYCFTVPAAPSHNNGKPMPEVQLLALASWNTLVKSVPLALKILLNPSSHSISKSPF